MEASERCSNLSLFQPMISKFSKPKDALNELAKKVPSTDSLTRLPKVKLRKKSKQRLNRWAIVVGYMVILIGVGGFVYSNRSASQTIRSSTLHSAIASADSQQNPLDQLSSAQIALTAAQMAKMPEIKSVRSQADSDSILLASPPSEATVIAKPMIVPTVQKSKQGIIRYTAQAGDSIPSIAAKYGLNADSIRWSNNISGNNVAAGTKLAIPPVNGIVYTVVAGDTPAKLAAKYKADEGQIVSYNDAELSGLTVGDQIIIPNGQKAAPAITLAVFTASYGGNGYDYGYCTYYVASRLNVPNNWGNANTWDNYAAASGWTVSSTPRAGAVAQTDAGWLGHVAVVEAVSPDGSMYKYSDMNGLAGWGRVGYSDWTPVGTRFQHFIYQ